MFILVSRIIIVSCAITIVTDAVRNPVRSVERCIDHSDGYPDLLDKDSVCYRYCDNTYFLKDKKARETNRQLAQARLISENGAVKRSKCCCRFNISWPDFVDPKAADVNLRNSGTAKGLIQCLPLVMQINLSKRTRDSYSTLCKYLTKPGPLTMLEVLKVVQLAAYLNFVRPKHPFIISVLNLKEVKQLSFDDAKQLADIIDKQLLDSYKQLDEYDGHKLRYQTMDDFTAIKKFRMKETLKSSIIAEAFDEYVVSYALVDLLAASKHVERVNKDSLNLPSHLIDGNYDSYHLDGAPIYFTVENLDCKLLKKARNRLRNYLAHIKMTLSVLYEKLIYEHVAMKYQPLSKLIETETVYKNLWNVNCDDQ